MAKMGSVVHVTEDHDEALEHIYRAIGAKILPFSKNVLLHFDSHPDMLIPRELKAADVFDTVNLFSMTSIENWIMPALFAGHISTVIWVKKEWATQIEDGLYKFSVGEDKSTGTIRCTSTQPYFVSELLYVPQDDLQNSKDITLVVATYSNTADSLEALMVQVERVTEGSQLILDIDLDYFSTTNPFLDIYSTNQLKILSKLYRFDEEKTAELSSAKRATQLETLHNIMSSVFRKYHNQSGTASQDVESADDERFSMVKGLMDEEVAAGKSLDVDLLHEHGCTFDTTGLPHHISTVSEIEGFVRDLLELLTRLCVQPKVITVARSSDDDYCPKHQVDLIEQLTIDCLKTAYKDISVEKHYL